PGPKYRRPRARPTERLGYASAAMFLSRRRRHCGAIGLPESLFEWGGLWLHFPEGWESILVQHLRSASEPAFGPPKCTTHDFLLLAALAGAPNPLVEFNKGLWHPTEFRPTVEWDLEFGVSQFLQRAEHVE